jgi:hypothetical protein
MTENIGLGPSSTWNSTRYCQAENGDALIAATAAENDLPSIG